MTFLVAVIAFNIVGWILLVRYQRHLNRQIHSWTATVMEFDRQRRPKFRARNGRSAQV
jgi:hypothetical protein